MFHWNTAGSSDATPLAPLLQQFNLIIANYLPKLAYQIDICDCASAKGRKYLQMFSFLKIYTERLEFVKWLMTGLVIAAWRECTATELPPSQSAEADSDYGKSRRYSARWATAWQMGFASLGRLSLSLSPSTSNSRAFLLL